MADQLVGTGTKQLVRGETGAGVSRRYGTGAKQATYNRTGGGATKAYGRGVDSLSLTAFVLDTFTDTDGTLVTAHTGELGATWVKHTGNSAFDNATIYSNRCEAVSTDVNYYASGTPASADYAVEAVFYCVNLTNSTFICGRMDTTNLNYYMAGYDCPSNQWRLLKRIGNTFTYLDQNVYVDVLAIGASRTVRLQMNGSNIGLYVNGILRSSGVDTDISAAGKAGFRHNSISQTTGVHIDSITATTATPLVSIKKNAGVSRHWGTGARVKALSGTPASGGDEICSFGLTGIYTPGIYQVAGGTAVTRLVGRGADAVTRNETGTAVSAHYGKGSSVHTIVYEKAGAGISRHYGSGTSQVSYARYKSGVGVSRHWGTGSSQPVYYNGQVFIKQNAGKTRLAATGARTGGHVRIPFHITPILPAADLTLDPALIDNRVRV